MPFIGIQFNMQKMQQIRTPKFFEVVRRHVLGVVGNVIYCLVGNLTDFSAVKEFWKTTKI